MNHQLGDASPQGLERALERAGVEDARVNAPHETRCPESRRRGRSIVAARPGPHRKIEQSLTSCLSVPSQTVPGKWRPPLEWHTHDRNLETLGNPGHDGEDRRESVHTRVGTQL